MTLGAMQDFELRVMRLLDHAAREHGDARDRQPLGRRARDAHRLGGHRTATRASWRSGWRSWGIKPGDRVATLGDEP